MHYFFKAKLVSFISTHLFCRMIILAKYTELSQQFVCVGKPQCGKVNVVPGNASRNSFRKLV